jgi:hypothetical protein
VILRIDTEERPRENLLKLMTFEGMVGETVTYEHLRETALEWFVERQLRLVDEFHRRQENLRRTTRKKPAVYYGQESEQDGVTANIPVATGEKVAGIPEPTG